FMVNATQKRGRGDDFIIERLENVKKPIYLVINKIDQIHPDKLLQIMDDYRNTLDYAEVFPFSVLEGNNCPELIDSLVNNLFVGLQYYLDDLIIYYIKIFL